MNRKHAISAPAAIALTKRSSRHAAPTFSSSVGLQASPTMQRAPRHIDTTWQDPDDYLAKACIPNAHELAQPHYPMGISDTPSFDPELSSMAIPQLSWSPVSSSELNSPQYSFDATDSSLFPSADMSREPTQSSYSSIFPEMPDLAMLRVKSEASCLSPSISQSCQPALPASYTPGHQPHFVPDQYHPYSHNQFDNHYASFATEPDAFDFISATEEQQRPDSQLAPPMQRDHSGSSSSSSSHISTSRASKRHRETLHHQSQRSLAPALNQHSSSSSFNLNEDTHQHMRSEQMIKVTSENGEEKVLIPKSLERHKRPTAPKLLCPHCNDHPDGFRGDHELQRHVSRAHSKVRKVWVCVDSSPDGKFLANCKACRTKKRYGAYYNAAAQ